MTRKEQKIVYQRYIGLMQKQDELMKTGKFDGTEIQCIVDEMVEKYFGLKENAVNPRNSIEFEQLMNDTEKTLRKLLGKK